MPVIKHKIISLLFVLLITPAVAQVTNIGEQLSGILQDSICDSNWKHKEDSLQENFYTQSKFITLTYTKNGKQKSLKNCKFIIHINNVPHLIKTTVAGVYPLTFKIDSTQTIFIHLTVGTTTMRQKLSSATQIQQGANIEFGQITNIRRQTKKFYRKFQGNSDGLSQHDRFNNQFLNNANMVYQIKQKAVNYMTYVEVTPTVWACGIVTQYAIYQKR